MPEEVNKGSFCGDHSSLASLILNTDVSTGYRIFGSALWTEILKEVEVAIEMEGLKEDLV